jgi:transcription elongation factor GreB
MSAKKPVNPLTRHGYNALAHEYNQSRDVERPKVVAGVSSAAADGDRSENAEYIYGKKRLREIDKRLRYLGGLLKDVKIVDPENLSGDRVCFGSTAIVQNEEGETKTYHIVGVGEAEFSANAISWKSPVGLALFGKKVGDVVNVITPGGMIELEIVDLFFASKNWRA